MARYYKLLALSIILLVIATNADAFKAKKEHKKSKDVKNKAKYEESFIEEGKNRQTKQHYQDHQRPARSVKNGKVKIVVEEPVEEKVYSKSKRGAKQPVEETLISRRPENSCGKKFECGIADKKRQKIVHLAIDEGNGRVSVEKKVKTPKIKHVYVNTDAIDGQEDFSPEEVEYRVRSKKISRERKIPAYLIVEDSTSENEEPEPKYPTKTLRSLGSRFIMESENEADLENTTGHRYENLIEDSNSDPGLNETEEEYEEDFL